MVKRKINGALAPSSPILGKDPNFLYNNGEPTEEMVRWYYTTPHTVSVNYEVIDDMQSIVEIVTRIGEFQKAQRITIGRNQKEQICKNYGFYH